jgi:DNA-binding SARP family transcriptional activator
LVAEGRVLGAIAIASGRRDFDVALASRVLFPVAALLGVYLRWANLAHDSEGAVDREVAARNLSRLRIYCLGPFRVEMDGTVLSADSFRRFKALTLLKFLVAHRGRPVPRETLMELLWPEADPVRVRGNLRVVLHALRRALEPALGKHQASAFVVSQSDLIYLDPSTRIWVDAEELVQRARRAAGAVAADRIDDAILEYQHASALYKGEYLEDEPYIDWCLFERERLREVYVSLMTQMASVLAERGEVAPAIDACRAALRVDHAREDMHRELMLLLWRAGRRDEALRQYSACSRILRHELDEGPAPETEALHMTILQDGHPQRSVT